MAGGPPAAGAGGSGGGGRGICRWRSRGWRSRWRVTVLAEHVVPKSQIATKLADIAVITANHADPRRWHMTVMAMGSQSMVESTTGNKENRGGFLGRSLPVRMSMSSPVHARKALHLVAMKAKLQSFLGLRLLVVAALAAFLLLFSARTLFSSSSSPGSAASSHLHLSGDGSCSKLPAPVADALVHYATSNSTPQQTAAEIGVSLRVLQRRSPCNFLDRFSKAFLCEAYLAEQVGRIRHFVIPSHREKPGTPFCPLS
ncbi:hypothetical protein TRIUR3_15142 [Triticum urartu]|uniref:Uncharacterized protein n=1 Tax=Triticum urartu TaxID=4572 RepID=M7ZFZ5_TRIUA|nr:hypothetical protein TRIUR3_15142 [Triticum urartu]